MSKEKQKKGCMTMDDNLRRLWQKLKIRGFLDRHLPFPLTAAESQNITKASMSIVAGTAIKLSMKAQSKNPKVNKNIAKIQAYATIPHEMKLRLRDAFKWDFELFGFDPMPPEVFHDFSGSDLLQPNLFSIY